MNANYVNGIIDKWLIKLWDNSYSSISIEDVYEVISFNLNEVGIENLKIKIIQCNSPMEAMSLASIFNASADIDFNLTKLLNNHFNNKIQSVYSISPPPT
ncbi:MAG: hypothetical protein GPJ54_16195 [Candidatus Heimdallarchaeota archaeon]|nr:hypothetical protein [Candidatus Heimdallarchaeota archaeon]